MEYFSVRDDVAHALATKAPVVALESTLISHGLPSPTNVECALAAEVAVRAADATPATIAVMDGQIVIGLSHAQIERLADPSSRPRKVSRRDLAATVALGETGSTTVSATMLAAARVGIEVFATGGIGGVHRGVAQSFDISADLAELSRTPVTVVCAGAKLILDLAKTVELLETLGVPVIGLGCDSFPGFFATDTGLALDFSVADVASAAAIVHAQRTLALDTGILLLNEAPAEFAVTAADAEQWIKVALEDAEQAKISGKAVTPYLLDRVNHYSDGASLRANVALIVSNARAAAELAQAICKR